MESGRVGSCGGMTRLGEKVTDRCAQRAGEHVRGPERQDRIKAQFQVGRSDRSDKCSEEQHRSEVADAVLFGDEVTGGDPECEGEKDRKPIELSEIRCGVSAMQLAQAVDARRRGSGQASVRSTSATDDRFAVGEISIREVLFRWLVCRVLAIGGLVVGRLSVTGSVSGHGPGLRRAHQLGQTDRGTSTTPQQGDGRCLDLDAGRDPA